MVPDERQRAVRVLLAGVAPCLAQALGDLLATEAALAVVGVAADTAQTIAQAAALAPDVVVLNLHVRELGGLETTRRLRAAAPRSRVLLVGDDEGEVYRAAARAAGADAYLLWHSVSGTLLPALRTLSSAPVPSGEPLLAAGRGGGSQ